VVLVVFVGSVESVTIQRWSLLRRRGDTGGTGGTCGGGVSGGVLERHPASGFGGGVIIFNGRGRGSGHLGSMQWSWGCDSDVVQV
jgi:hypothetical protein